MPGRRERPARAVAVEVGHAPKGRTRAPSSEGRRVEGCVVEVIAEQCFLQERVLASSEHRGYGSGEVDEPRGVVAVEVGEEHRSRGDVALAELRRDVGAVRAVAFGTY